MMSFDEWSKFIIASKVLKIVRDQQPTLLFQDMMKTYYEEPRFPGVGLFYDASCFKVGRQAIQNRLHFMRSIKYPWNQNQQMSNDLIRIEMKKAYFSYVKILQPVATNNQIDTCTAPLADYDPEWFFPLGEAIITN